MGTQKINKIFRKTRSKRQRGGGTINNDLLNASYYGHTESVAMLLKNGAAVNAKDKDGRTALFWASIGGHIVIVAMLLEKGADVKARSNVGNTALITASIKGHTETVAMLLKNGADVNEENHRGLSALSAAGLKGHTETVVMLLEKGANVHGIDKEGSTAIILASRRGHTETVKVLEDYIKNKENKANAMIGVTEYKRPNISGLSTLAYQSVPTDVDTYINLNPGTIRRPYGKLGGKRKSKKSKKSTKRFRRTRSKRQGGGVTDKEENDKSLLDAIMMASLNGDTKIVAMLLNNGADVNATNDIGYTPLMLACDCDIDLPYYQVEYVMKYKKKIVEMLLNHPNIDVNAKDNEGYTALDIAYETECFPEIIKLLITYIIAQPIPKHLETQRERKKDRQNLRVLMMQKGVHPDLEQFTGYYLGGKRKTRSKRQGGGTKITDIIQASMNGRTESAEEMLLKNRENNNTALIWASRNGHTNTVEMILNMGADVNAKDNSSNTALIRASKNGHTETATMLLENGADVNAKDNDNWTALIEASENKQTEIVALLLENGADVNATDVNGKTALFVASINGYTEIVALLLENGAHVNTTDNYGNTALFVAHRDRHTETVKLLKQHIVAQNLPRHLERQQDRENLAMVMSEKNVGNRGDGTMPYELRHEIGNYLGGGIRRTKKIQKKIQKKTS